MCSMIDEPELEPVGTGNDLPAGSLIGVALGQRRPFVIASISGFARSTNGEHQARRRPPAGIPGLAAALDPHPDPMLGRQAQPQARHDVKSLTSEPAALALV